MRVHDSKSLKKTLPYLDKACVIKSSSRPHMYVNDKTSSITRIKFNRNN